MLPGTLYSEYEPCVFGKLRIKEASIAQSRDFFFASIADSIACTGSAEFNDKLDAAEKAGASLAMDFDVIGRDAMFDTDDRLYAVWERADVEALITRLQKALHDSAGEKP